ncbi:MAG: hypothetical protein BIFFINMI_02076 [Phycisphaerae bacterium]|nr:hypothetical protein [Phycisphaerae bacterium]
MAQPTEHAATPVPRREFAFSRIAGASPSDYAAISRLAVTAVVAALFSWLGLIWTWGLVAPAIAVALAALSLYYIATSAGTLTGRRVALAAVILAVAVGGSAAIIQLKAYRDRQQDIAAVAELARECSGWIEHEQWDAIFAQASPELRDKVPSAYWNWTWSRWIAAHGRIRSVEIYSRTRFLSPVLLLVSLNVRVTPAADRPGPDRIYSMRLIYQYWTEQDIADYYGKVAQELDLPELANLAANEKPGWRLNMVPDLAGALPPPYAQPIEWPAPGPIEQVIVVKGEPLPLPRIVPPGIRAPAIDPQTQKLQAELALPPLVPPASTEEPLLIGPPRQAWLTAAPPPPPPAPHEH